MTYKLRCYNPRTQLQEPLVYYTDFKTLDSAETALNRENYIHPSKRYWVEDETGTVVLGKRPVKAPRWTRQELLKSVRLGTPTSLAAYHALSALLDHHLAGGKDPRPELYSSIDQVIELLTQFKVDVDTEFTRVLGSPLETGTGDLLGD